MTNKKLTILRRLLSELLIKSLNTEQMNDLGRSVDPSFNVYDFSGFGEKIVIPRKVAASCILQNFHTEEKLLAFIAYMISRNGQGASGGVIHLKGHKRILDFLEEERWLYNPKQALFMKDQTLEQSHDWGIMKEDHEYAMSFVSIDIVASSELVRTNVKEDVEITVGRLKEFVSRFVENWDGRLWFWYGDGGVAAFYGPDCVPMGSLAMASLLQNLPLFNIIQNELRPENDIKLRIGMHYGTVIYKNDVNQITSPAMKLAQDVEKHFADPNSLAISGAVYQILPPEIRHNFQKAGEFEGMQMYKYIPA